MKDLDSLVVQNKQASCTREKQCSLYLHWWISNHFFWATHLVVHDPLIHGCRSLHQSNGTYWYPTGHTQRSLHLRMGSTMAASYALATSLWWTLSSRFYHSDILCNLLCKFYHIPYEVHLETHTKLSPRYELLCFVLFVCKPVDCIVRPGLLLQQWQLGIWNLTTCLDLQTVVPLLQ